jgi:hypothetical protein
MSKLHRLHRRIAVGPDHLDRAVLQLELLAAARGENGDDVVRQLRHLAHQLEHGFARGLDHPGVHASAHLEVIGRAAQEPDLAHELRRPERVGEHPLAGVGVGDLDLAFEDVDETVEPLADVHDDRTGGVELLAPDRADGIDMGRCERHAAHGFKVLSERFHATFLL